MTRTTSPSCLCSVPRPVCIKGLDIPSAPYLTLAELFMPHNNGMNHSTIAALWKAGERKRNQGIQFYAFQMIMKHFPNMQERFMNKGWINAFILVCWFNLWFMILEATNRGVSNREWQTLQGIGRSGLKIIPPQTQDFLCCFLFISKLCL